MPNAIKLTSNELLKKNTLNMLRKSTIQNALLANAKLNYPYRKMSGLFV